MNIYVEEIPAKSDDGEDDSSQTLQDFDTKEEALAAEAQRDDHASQKVRLEGGGVLQDLKFETCSLGDPGRWLEAQSLTLDTEVIDAAAVNGGRPSARGGSSLVRLGDDIVLFGGAARDGAHFDDLWKFCTPCKAHGDAAQRKAKKPATTWTNLTAKAKGSGPRPRCGHSATAIGNRYMVVFGGLNGAAEEIYNDVHILTRDRLEDGGDAWSWTTPNLCGAPPKPRTEACAAALGNKIIFFGGSSPDAGVFRDMHVLHLDRDAKSGTWTTVRCEGVPPLGRELAACVLLQPTPGSDNNRDAMTDANHARGLEHYGAHLIADPERRLATEPPAVSTISEESRARANARREEGNRKFVAGDLETAAKSYSEGLEANPRDAFLYGNRSACMLKLGDAETALQDALSAVRLDPLWGKAYYREAMALVALDRHDEAHAALQSAVELAKSAQERDAMLRASHEIARDHPVPAVAPSSAGYSGPSSAEDLLLCVHGGKGAEGVLRDLQFFDIRAARWLAPAQESPFPRCGHSMWQAGGRVVIFGGWDGGINVAGTAAALDPASGKWKECSAAQHSRARVAERFSHAACELRGGEALVFGGVSFKSDHADLVRLGVHEATEEGRAR